MGRRNVTAAQLLQLVHLRLPQVKAVLVGGGLLRLSVSGPERSYESTSLVGN
jgi:hypothetical protein